MILKLKINRRKKRITIWIQKHKDFNKDVKQILQFFKENVKISKKRRLYKYYKIGSDNPAIMMSLFSTIHDLIPEVYFNSENLLEHEKSLSFEKSQ